MMQIIPNLVQHRKNRVAALAGSYSHTLHSTALMRAFPLLLAACGATSTGAAAGAVPGWTLMNATRCFNDDGQTDGLPDVSACAAACAARGPGCTLFSFCAAGTAPSCPLPGSTGCWFFPPAELSACQASAGGAAGWTSGWRPAPSPAPPAPPPADWLAAIARGDKLYAATDATVPGSLMPEIGNGFVASQVGSDALWVAGVYNGYLTADPSHRARVPTTLAVAAPGVPGPAALDVREATFYRRSFLDPSPPGTCTLASAVSCSNAPGRIWIEQRFYAHRAVPSLLVMEVAVLPPPAASPTPPPPPQQQQQAAPYAMLALVNAPGAPSADIDFAIVPVAPGAGFAIVNGSTKVSETNTSGLTAVAVLTTDLVPVLAIPAASPFDTHAFFTIIRTSIETRAADLVDAVQVDLATAAALAANGSLHASHVAEWAATIWTAGFGTDRMDVARATNASLYAILSSVRNDRIFGISPGGLTPGYNGHQFWDQETWMQPAVQLLHPDIANSFITYRLNRLAGARQKAQSYAPPFSGAMFPWEDAFTGEETCPSWAATGLREIHINGDIALALWAFWRAMLDNSAGWLGHTAMPILSGIAEFWMSKLAIDNAGAPAGAPLSLNGVIPPDEYADHVNNSVYTNYGAIMTLTYAARVAQLLGQPPSSYAPWEDAAARIVIPFNGTYHPEYDGYKPGTQIKQADVILLGFPLEAQLPSMTPASRAADLAVYAAVTDSGGPAMTWGMFAVGYIDLGAGYEHLAAANFNRSFANAQPPFDVSTGAEERRCLPPPHRRHHSPPHLACPPFPHPFRRRRCGRRRPPAGRRISARAPAATCRRRCRATPGCASTTRRFRCRRCCPRRRRWWSCSAWRTWAPASTRVTTRRRCA